MYFKSVNSEYMNQLEKKHESAHHLALPTLKAKILMTERCFFSFIFWHFWNPNHNKHSVFETEPQLR